MALLGTFLVRSGVLTSVHAFAVDPRRGIAGSGVVGDRARADFLYVARTKALSAIWVRGGEP